MRVDACGACLLPKDAVGAGWKACSPWRDALPFPWVVAGCHGALSGSRMSSDGWEAVCSIMGPARSGPSGLVPP